MSYGKLVDRHVQESWSVPPPEQHVVQYTCSKGMVELKPYEAFPELSLAVVQPSIVVGRSELGCAPLSSIFWMLRMIALLETFSCRLSDRINILPVDDRVETIIWLAFKPMLAHDPYHISADNTRSEQITTLYPRVKHYTNPGEGAQALVDCVHQEKIEEKALVRKFLRLAEDDNARLAA